jgi:hypothetical protein
MEFGGTKGEVVGRLYIKDLEDCASESFKVGNRYRL